jgi:hypothetical protein
LGPLEPPCVDRMAIPPRTSEISDLPAFCPGKTQATAIPPPSMGKVPSETVHGLGGFHTAPGRVWAAIGHTSLSAARSCDPTARSKLTLSDCCSNWHAGSCGHTRRIFGITGVTRLFQKGRFWATAVSGGIATEFGSRTVGTLPSLAPAFGGGRGTMSPSP